MNGLREIIEFSKPLRLLYVEDNVEVHKYTLELLKQFFEKIAVAIDGKEGLEVFENEAIDIVITDINMPKLNGLEMVKYIKSINKDISVIVLSAFNEKEYLEEANSIGVESYIMKPLTLKTLVNGLETIKKLKVGVHEIEYGIFKNI